MKKPVLKTAAAAIIILSSTSCREESIIFPPEPNHVTDPAEKFSEIEGFYLLNEGNMGSNKSTLDRFDYSTGIYTRNIYGEANPDVPKELGDVGNDLKIYGSRLYAVINCSNKIEVMDAKTTRRIGQIEIPNCRFIQFHGKYAYVTSYAGPVEIRPDYSQKGYVAKVDTATLQVVDKCIVGYQPDELAITGGKIYVANSGGYMVPNYENTLSVIDLDSFVEEKRVEVALNLFRVRPDSKGRLWVSSRGDYYDNHSKLYCFNPKTEQIEKEFDVPVSAMDIVGDSIYIVSTSWSYRNQRHHRHAPDGKGVRQLHNRRHGKEHKDSVRRKSQPADKRSVRNRRGQLRQSRMADVLFSRRHTEMESAHRRHPGPLRLLRQTKIASGPFPDTLFTSLLKTFICLY